MTAPIAEKQALARPEPQPATPPADPLPTSVPPEAPAADPPPSEKPPEPKPIDLRELSGKRYVLIEKPRFAFELPKSNPPAPGSLQHWGMQKEAPAWLVAAMAVGQPVNKLWAESEFDELAQKTATLTLGRKGA